MSHIRSKEKKSCHSIRFFRPLNSRHPIASVFAVILLLWHPCVLPLEIHRPARYNYSPLQHGIHIIRDE
jgi:hypothetical protein